VDPSPPAFGQPSAAASREPVLRDSGDAMTAALRAEGGSTDWCTLRAASVVGVRHRLNGQPTDDSYAWACDPSGLAVAVADGIGATRGAGEAAHRATTAAVRAALAAGVEEAVRAANRAAEGGGATTLVVARIAPDGEISLGRVGDSSAFVVKPGGDWSELFDAPDDERVGSDTVGLPSHDPAVELVSALLPEGGVIALGTDGLADPWRDGPTTVAPRLAAALLERPAPHELAALIDFSRHGCHDDRTALCVWPR
jgi:hypothetical protein